MKIWVLHGGEGAERDVSLRSGAAVASALLGKGWEAEPVDLRNRGDASAFIEKKEGFAFIALHGGWGEDGTLQAALEMAGIPFSGSGHAACALAMDKTAGKALFREKGIPVPKGIEVSRRGADEESLSGACLEGLLERSGKLVVKPCCSGSTVGVSILDGSGRLGEALEEAFRHDNRVLVEEYIPGREITVTVHERHGRPVCLPVIEIRPRGGFYDYGSKYTPGGSEYRVPAPLEESVRKAVEQAALGAYEALGCRAYGRVDLRLDDDGTPVVLELNTVPGMTATSLVPKAAAAAGISFGEFLGMVVESSLSR